MSRATHSHEMRERPELLDVLPGEDLRDRIGPGDEEQVGIGALGADVAQRVDRERRLPRSMSTRLTVNRGFDAVAITVMR